MFHDQVTDSPLEAGQTLKKTLTSKHRSFFNLRRDYAKRDLFSLAPAFGYNARRSKRPLGYQ